MKLFNVCAINSLSLSLYPKERQMQLLKEPAFCVNVNYI